MFEMILNSRATSANLIFCQQPDSTRELWWSGRGYLPFWAPPVTGNWLHNYHPVICQLFLCTTQPSLSTPSQRYKAFDNHLSWSFSPSFNDVFICFFEPEYLPVLFQGVPSNHANSSSPLSFLFPINQYSNIWLIKLIIQLIIIHFVVGSSLPPCQEFFSTCSQESPHLPCWLLIGDHHRCVCIFSLYSYLVSALGCHTGKGTSGHIGMESSE